jgi:hypothetical protein
VLIRTWKPWERSTGPRTAEGKAQAVTNARVFHGWSPENQAMRDECKAFVSMARGLLDEHRKLLGQVQSLCIPEGKQR